MNFYPIAEHELASYGMMNALVNVLLAIGVGLITLGGGIYITSAFVDKPTPEGTILIQVVAPLILFLGAISIALCIWAYIKRQGIWGKIKSGSMTTAE
jgi:hypothetical protein